MILALDPSSTCTGYALFAGGKMQEAGTFRPTKRDAAPLVRMAQMAADLRAMIQTTELERVVIEVSTKPQARGRQRASSIATYAMAVGYLLRTAQDSGVPVEAVEVNEWSRSRPKARRNASVARLHAGYDAAKDRGGDAADAIGLGEWWIRNQGVRR